MTTCAVHDCNTINETQRAFLRLHVKKLVERWRWHFQDTQLRAYAGKRTATISRAEFDDLISRGLMFKGHGAADVHPTETGRQLI